MWALVVAIPNALHSDKTGERFFHFAWPAATCCVGFIIAMTSHNTGARYFAAFMMTSESSMPHAYIVTYFFQLATHQALQFSRGSQTPYHDLDQSVLQELPSSMRAVILDPSQVLTSGQLNTARTTASPSVHRLQFSVQLSLLPSY